MSEARIEAKPSDLSVVIGLPTGSHVPWQTAMSLAATTKACAEKGIEIDVACVAGSSIITEARNQVVHQYLKSRASRLFWIDSDIAWQPEDFLRLLVFSAQMDVVCAAYPRKRPDTRFTIKHTLPLERNSLGCVKIEGTGLGFTVMRREVVEKVVEGCPQYIDEAQDMELADVFRLDLVRGNHRRGEDMAFFADIRSKGYDVWLDPSVQLGHVGTHVFTADPAVALGLK